MGAPARRSMNASGRLEEVASFRSGYWVATRCRVCDAFAGANDEDTSTANAQPDSARELAPSSWLAALACVWKSRCAPMNEVGSLRSENWKAHIERLPFAGEPAPRGESVVRACWPRKLGLAVTGPAQVSSSRSAGPLTATRATSRRAAGHPAARHRTSNQARCRACGPTQSQVAALPEWIGSPPLRGGQDEAARARPRAPLSWPTSLRASRRVPDHRPAGRQGQWPP